MKTRILIATKSGPSEVIGFSHIQDMKNNHALIKDNGQSIHLDQTYIRFLNKIFQRDSTQTNFQIVITKPLDDDESWNLGLYLAYQLWKKGTLATSEDDPTQIWLVAGKIRERDKRVLSVESCESRIDNAYVSLLEYRAKGQKVCTILPKMNNPHDNLGLAGHVMSINYADDLLGRQRSPKTRIKDTLVWLCLFLFLVIVVWVDLQSTAVLQVWRKDTDREELYTLPKNPYDEQAENFFKNKVDWRTIKKRKIHKPNPTQIRPFTNTRYQTIDAYISATPHNMHPNGDMGPIKFRILSLRPSDGGSCHEMRKRAASIKIGQMNQIFKSNILDGDNICGIRLLIFNTEISPIKANFSYRVTPDTLMSSQNPISSWRALDLSVDSVYQQDFYFSLSEIGKFNFELILEYDGIAQVNSFLIKRNKP